MKIRILVTLLCIVSISACRKELEPVTEPSTIPRNADPGDGDLDVLGYGYNIQGDYASSTSATRRVIDVRKLRQERRSKIAENQSRRTYFEMRSGSNYTEFNKSYEQSYGGSAKGKIFGLKLFETHLKTKFGGSVSTNSTYSYATIDMLVERKILEIYNDQDVDIIRDYLDQEFKADCVGLSPQALLNKYGAGVLRKIKVGGKLTADYQSNVSNSSSSKKSDVEAGAKAGFKSLFNVDVNVSNSTTSGQSQNNSNQRFKYESIGGAGNSIMGESTLGSTASININNWSSTVTESNSVLVGFFDDTFIPIYQLIPDIKKARAVRKLVYQTLGREVVDGNSHNFELPGDIVFMQDLSPVDDTYYYYMLRVRNNRVITLGGDFWPSPSPSGPVYASIAARHIYQPSQQPRTMFVSNYVNDNVLLFNGPSGYQTNENRRALWPEVNFLLQYSHPREYWRSDRESYDDHLGLQWWIPGARLVRNSVDNKYYLQAHGVLYPFYSDNNVDDYGFHRSSATMINGTGGLQIGEAI